ncbi:MAG TPA: YncE family protein [Gemmatimonadaceae bacterium]|nr:YncE family protein [Gemmatimonadaceae bacterium]
MRPTGKLPTTWIHRRGPLLALALLALALLAGAGCRDGVRAESRTPGDSAHTERSGRAQPQPACSATATSLTPGGWAAHVADAPADAPRGPLQLLADIPLPGPANRFDYQSIDPARGRLYISHMDAGRVVVFDLDSSRVVAEVGGTPRVTGILAVPARHTIYASAAGAHQLAAIDDRTLAITARVGGIRFPDGIAYAPAEQKLFVSDESGGADVVIDARTNTKRRAIPLGGEAGNTHFDSVSHCVLVAVQTRNQLVAIDPASERVVQRYGLPGSDHPHGFTLDEPGRLAFISGEGNARLLVVDLRSMRVLATHEVGGDPDVLAWDPGWRRLYVASESGVVTAYAAEGTRLEPLGELRMPHAHTVAVDPRTHRVYLPLESLHGRPVLRILAPGAAARR